MHSRYQQPENISARSRVGPELMSRYQKGLASMQRLVWLALFCLAGIGGLFAVRSAVGVTQVGKAAPQAIAADVSDPSIPLAKGDRLPSRSFDSILPKTSVATVKIVPFESPRRPEASNDDVVSWHWHEGSKVIRRRRAQ
jgi:hypothetical protein